MRAIAIRDDKSTKLRGGNEVIYEINALYVLFDESFSVSLSSGASSIFNFLIIPSNIRLSLSIQTLPFIFT
jgi:hypothetical protein